MDNNTITYFDRTALQYSSLFLSGFYQNSRHFGFNFVVCKEIPEFLADPKFAIPLHTVSSFGFKRPADVVLNCIGLFKAKRHNEEFYFCIDASDHSRQGVSEDGLYYGYHIPLLEKVKFYFKVNYNNREIRENAVVHCHAAKIIPVPLVYPSHIPHIWHFLPPNPLRTNSAFSRMSNDLRLRDMIKLISMGDISRYRSRKKNIDILFLVYYYDNPIHRDDNERRHELITKIREQKTLTSLTGFVCRHPLPGKYAPLQTSNIFFPNYLHTLSKSRIAVYMRGVHDCISFKFGHFLEMGMPIVGQPLINNKDYYYSYDLFSDQLKFEEPTEIVRRAVELLKSPVDLDLLGKKNADFFDRFLTPTAITASMVKRLMV